MSTKNVVNAILAINPNAQVGVDGNDVNKIIWRKDTPVIPKEDIEAKMEELLIEYEAKQYQLDRVLVGGSNTYPSTEDQLDMLFHDKKDGTTTWEDAVQAVKDAHPKP